MAPPARKRATDVASMLGKTPPQRGSGPYSQSVSANSNCTRRPICSNLAFLTEKYTPRFGQFMEPVHSSNVRGPPVCARSSLSSS